MVGDAEIVYVLRYFHGGIFKTSPKFEYENGMMERFQVDPDKLCLWDILDNVKLLGYGHHPFVYYRVPTEEFNCDGLVLIHNDDTVRQVINLLIKKGSVDIYVDHKIDTGEGCPKINEMVEGSKGIMLEDAKEHSDSEKGVDVGGDELGADVDALEAAGEDLRAVIEELHADCEEVMVVVNEGISPGADEGFLPVTGEGFGPNAAQRLETNGGERFETNVAQGSLLLKDVCEDLRIEVDEESTNELNEDDDHHCFLYDVELLSDLDDEVLSIRTKLIDKEKKRTCSESNKVGLYVSNDNSDEECGQDIEVEDYALEEYEVKGRDGKVEGHESDYLDSSDPGEYGDSDESAEEICGTYSGKKTLGPRYDIKCAIPTWEVGMRFEDNIQFKEAVKKYSVANGVKLKFVKNEPKRTRVATLKEMCQTELGAYATYDMCRRARKAILKEMQGSYVEEFANLWGMLLSCYAPILVVQCQFRWIEKMEVQDFIGWVLLVAVGRDGNNQMFPVAWAIVEGEGKESWRWMCARHIYASWYKKWKGMNRKIQFWNTVKATFVEDFDEQLQKLESLGVKSSNDLLETPVECWSKAYFKGTSKCDVVDNNMAEAFNGWILEARCKPIITMLEEIRTMVMNRMNIKRTWAETWRTNISPKALQKLERNMENSTQCRLVWNGDGGFEVNHLGNQHTVDLKKWTCTCREWEINGIPCCHAICAMYHDSKKPEAYVSEWYSKEKYLASYNHFLQPVRGKKFWPKGLPSILPPKVKVQPGRPKKNRIKSKDEPKKVKAGKYTRAGVKMTCSVCKTTGHNKQKCPQTTNIDNSTKDYVNVNVGTTSIPKLASTTVASTSKKNVTHHSTEEGITNQEKGIVQSTTANIINVQSSDKRKRPIGIGLYTDLQTGEQLLNPGMSSERVVTVPVSVPRKIGAHTSQFQHSWKGPGLSWKGKKAVTTRQLQQENSNASRKHKIRKTQ
ncbi:hypothetical protein GQ457_11G025520 [Hibiscus cannabinus]